MSEENAVIEINVFRYLYDCIRSKIYIWLFGLKCRTMTTEALIDLLGELECKCASCGKREL